MVQRSGNGDYENGGCRTKGVIKRKGPHYVLFHNDHVRVYQNNIYHPRQQTLMKSCYTKLEVYVEGRSDSDHAHVNKCKALFRKKIPQIQIVDPFPIFT